MRDEEKVNRSIVDVALAIEVFELSGSPTQSRRSTKATHLVVVEDDDALVLRQLEIELHRRQTPTSGLCEALKRVLDLGLLGNLCVISSGRQNDVHSAAAMADL